MNSSLLEYAGLAFLGGIILNVMPCVLPVLTMKIFHVIEKAQEDPRVNRRHGLAYTAGIVASFWAFAALLIALRAGGKAIGWGMHFQNPVFVATMCALIFAFGLNALGVFELTIGMGGVEGGESYRASFVNGIVASIMSTPCSAPFLGTAAAFALGSNAAWWHTLVVFTFIALGLAAPFLVVSYVPAIGRRLPRPGPWMDNFKKLMGFTLLGAAVWLFGVLEVQLVKPVLKAALPPAAAEELWKSVAAALDQVTYFVAFLLALGLVLWGQQAWGGIEHATRRRVVVKLVAAGVAVASGWWLVDLTVQKPAPLALAPEVGSAGSARAALEPVVVDGKINWKPFDPATVKTALESGRPVFMDYTAEWCVNCKTNEKAFIETAPIRKDLEETQILPVKADYTNEDDTIHAWMQKLGRNAVPIYVVYMPDGTNDLLPEVITTEMLSKSLRAAAQKFPPEKFRPAGKTASAEPRPDGSAAAEDKTAAAR
jgi:thiol:disulfide interchange protein DsbD